MGMSTALLARRHSTTSSICSQTTSLAHLLPHACTPGLQPHPLQPSLSPQEDFGLMGTVHRQRELQTQVGQGRHLRRGHCLETIARPAKAFQEEEPAGTEALGQGWHMVGEGKSGERGPGSGLVSCPRQDCSPQPTPHTKDRQDGEGTKPEVPCETVTQQVKQMGDGRPQQRG